MANISDMRGTYAVTTINGEKLNEKEMSELRQRINGELNKFNESIKGEMYNTYFNLENNIPEDNNEGIILKGSVKGEGRWSYPNNISFFTNEKTPIGETLKGLNLSGVTITIVYEDCEVSNQVFIRGMFSLVFKEPYSLPEVNHLESAVLIWYKETFRNSIYFNDEEDIEWVFYSEMYPLQRDWERMDEEEQLRVTFMELLRHDKIVIENIKNIELIERADYVDYISKEENKEFLKKNILLGKEYYMVSTLEDELKYHKKLLEELLRIPLDNSNK